MKNQLIASEHRRKRLKNLNKKYSRIPELTATLSLGAEDTSSESYVSVTALAIVEINKAPWSKTEHLECT